MGVCNLDMGCDGVCPVKTVVACLCYDLAFLSLVRKLHEIVMPQVCKCQIRRDFAFYRTESLPSIMSVTSFLCSVRHFVSSFNMHAYVFSLNVNLSIQSRM